MKENETKFILADPQDITRAGLFYILSSIENTDAVVALDKGTMLEQLHNWRNNAVVVMDYTLFDVNDADELFILSQSFSSVHWIIFSFDLTTDFCRRLLAMSPQFSILLKDAPMAEIKQCLTMAMHQRRFICQATAAQLITPMTQTTEEEVALTKTETEILHDIALGLTTREIAQRRFSSFHTVNTHRKNIFRKLHVNNVHEAIRYALRAGLVDAAEYYI